MSAALDPHCWNATSFADPEYVMDLGSPNAFCALAITVFESCAIAFPHRYARQIATRASLFTTATPPLWGALEFHEARDEFCRCACSALQDVVNRHHLRLAHVHANLLQDRHQGLTKPIE